MFSEHKASVNNPDYHIILKPGIIFPQPLHSLCEYAPRTFLYDKNKLLIRLPRICLLLITKFV